MAKFDLNQRVDVVNAVSEKYYGKEFALGSNDCVHMIAHGLREYGLKSSLHRFGSYSTPAGARRALKRAGYDSLIEAVRDQGFFELDGAAMAWPGDIIAMKAEDDDGVALAWMASNGRAFGFWNGIGQYFQPHEFEAAWRVA